MHPNTPKPKPLAAKEFRGRYDFLYVPIDFKNKLLGSYWSSVMGFRVWLFRV